MNDEQMETLVFLWKEYGLEVDEKLTIGARTLKRKLRKYVERLPAFTE